MNDLLARLIAAGTPAHLVAEVAMELGRAQGERDALERRRATDRERQRQSREAKKIAESNECHVTSRDVTVVTDEPLPSPSPSFPPDPQTNPTPAHPRERTPRARKGGFDLPSHIPADAWDGWLEMRKRIGKPATDRAKTLAIAELDRLSADGWPPGEVLNHCTMNSYQGIFPPKGSKNERSHHDRSQRDEIRDPMVRAVLARQAERAAGRGVEPQAHAGDWP